MLDFSWSGCPKIAELLIAKRVFEPSAERVVAHGHVLGRPHALVTRELWVAADPTGSKVVLLLQSESTMNTGTGPQLQKTWVQKKLVRADQPAMLLLAIN